MTRYALRRVLLVIPVLIGITLITFLFLQATGDPCAALLGERVSADRCAEIYERYGLNDPLPQRYLRYLGTILQGDLGRSITSKRPVVEELSERLPATAELSFAAITIAIVVSIPLGVVAAARHNTPVDLSAMVAALVGVSMPVFWLGLMLLWLFGYKLGWFPTGGRLSTGVPPPTFEVMGHEFATGMYVLDSILSRDMATLADALRHLFLPALALATIPAAFIARITRSGMLDVLRREYVRTARAKGLTERAVIGHHAFANALLPVVTVVGLQMGFLLSGAVLTETIFSWPGMGQWVVEAIPANDVPVVLACVLVFALVFVAINLIVDLSYAVLDPRIRYR
jgi:peptide/nickel transport system permease protein